MLSITEKFFKLTRQLLPTGRAFNINENSMKARVEKAFIASEERFYADSLAVLNSILPDNEFFTAEDATRWEQRLGLIVNEDVALADRKAAILRKMNHPGDIRARQGAGYIQDQLQQAGFNVFVHENIPETDITTLVSGWSQVQYGQVQYGEVMSGQYFYNNIIANHIEAEKDLLFLPGSSYRCTFFIGGENLGDYANVDANRKAEFRQLVLKIKPAQTVAYLQINYI